MHIKLFDREINTVLFVICICCLVPGFSLLHAEEWGGGGPGDKASDLAGVTNNVFRYS